MEVSRCRYLDHWSIEQTLLQLDTPRLQFPLLCSILRVLIHGTLGGVCCISRVLCSSTISFGCLLVKKFLKMVSLQGRHRIVWNHCPSHGLGLFCVHEFLLILQTFPVTFTYYENAIFWYSTNQIQNVYFLMAHNKQLGNITIK